MQDMDIFFKNLAIYFLSAKTSPCLYPNPLAIVMAASNSDACKKTIRGNLTRQVGLEAFVIVNVTLLTLRLNVLR